MMANQFPLIGGTLLAREVRGHRAVAETQAGLKCTVPGPRPLQET